MCSLNNLPFNELLKVKNVNFICLLTLSHTIELYLILSTAGLRQQIPMVVGYNGSNVIFIFPHSSSRFFLESSKL